MNRTTLRMKEMVLGWGAVGCVYTATSLLSRPGRMLTESVLDRLISFDTAGIWWYLSFFVLIPLAFCLAPVERLAWLRRAFQLSALVCGIVFLVAPTTMHYPDAMGSDLSAKVWRVLHASDTAQNCLPSLHGALTALSAWALCTHAHMVRSVLAVLWSLAIAYAVIQTRRHLSIDLGAGILVGLGAGCFARSTFLIQTSSLRISISCRRFPE